VNIPREVATYSVDEPAAAPPPVRVPRAPAYLPLDYISDSRQRIEVYRKLAQATDKGALDTIAREARDRFGPLPPAVETLLQVAELKLVASDKGVTVIETREDKLLLTRAGDLITIGGRLPRLTKKDAAGRLKEIKKMLLSL
jgi:transcription-repair coupling factor (superfamily II helicase)